MIILQLLVQLNKGSYQESLLYPVLLHTSSLTEAHHYPLRSGRSILLHTHSSAPFIQRLPGQYLSGRGLNMTIFSTGECGVAELELTVDWWNSLSRWGPRYWNAVLAWGAAVIGIVFQSSWSIWDAGCKSVSVAIFMAFFIY